MKDIPEKQHALLSASGAERWLNCTPSMRLTEHMPDTESKSAAEGTNAHTLAEYKLRIALGETPEADPRATLTYLDGEMEQHTDNYVTHVLEIIGMTESPLVLIEQQIDLSKYVPEGFGTADCVIIADKNLHIIDFKYGQMEVSAENNPQMGLYALGVLDSHDYIYGIEDVKMSIFQPRINNISTFTTTAESLYQWGENVVKTAAKSAWDGEGDFQTGTWCTFCKAKPRCREYTKQFIELVKYQLKEPPLLDDDEITDILGKVDGLVSWAEKVKDYAFQEALGGKKWSGYKLIYGKSSGRKITDTNKAAEILRKNGYKDFYKSELLGITALKKLVGGDNALNKLLEDVLYTPPGKPALVHESKKGEPYEITTTKDIVSQISNEILEENHE